MVSPPGNTLMTEYTRAAPELTLKTYYSLKKSYHAYMISLLLLCMRQAIVIQPGRAEGRYLSLPLRELMSRGCLSLLELLRGRPTSSNPMWSNDSFKQASSPGTHWAYAPPTGRLADHVYKPFIIIT